MRKDFRCRLWIDRVIAGETWKQVVVAGGVFALAFIIIGIIYLANRHTFGQAFVDMVSPVTAQKEAYDESPDGKVVLGRFIVYSIGAIVFTGLLIATITSALRTRVDKFKQGTVKYYFRHHIVFLGYDDMVVGMIQKLCDDGEPRIVVGVESKANEVNDLIKNRIYNKHKNKVVVLQADSCNKKDIERLRIPYADKVFVIGEHDDAYNLKSYRTIYELSLCSGNFEERMPQCYVNLQHQSTLTLFQTYATTGDIGVDFSHFHTFNFYDEWARYMIVGADLERKLRMDYRDTETKNPRQIHLVIVGMSEMGRALARQAVLLCHYPSYVTHKIRTKITFIDPEAMQHAQRLVGHYQRLYERCHYATYDASAEKTFENDVDGLDVEFDFYETDISNLSMRNKLAEWSADPKQMLTIAICQPKAAQSLAAGIYLPDSIYHQNADTPIWIYQPTFGDLGNYMKGSRYKNVVTFGMSGESLDVCNETIIGWSMRINHYLKNRKNGVVNYSNSRLIELEWQENTVYQKWTCINRAMHILVMLHNTDYMNNETNELYAKVELSRGEIESLMGMEASDGEALTLEKEKDYIKELKHIVNI